jgi:predicted NAD/FAD-binding protein
VPSASERIAGLVKQTRSPERQGQNGSWFAGRFCGYGFSKGALRSEAAEQERRHETGNPHSIPALILAPSSIGG